MTKSAKVPGKTKKSKKSANAPPKRARTAYMLFASGIRKKLAEEHPQASFGELGKLAGEQWKNLSEEDKQPFVDASKAEKVEAEKAMKDYKEQQAQASLVLTSDEAEQLRSAIEQAHSALETARNLLSSTK